MEKIICPSMMCANFSNSKNEVRNLESAGADIFHMDIMDGQFVPNFGMGLQDYAYIASIATKPLDAHLMIMNPNKYIKLFSDLGAGIIYFHPEADLHPARTIDLIHAEGKEAGIALNPGTSISTVEPLLEIVEHVLVMTVNPGFSGQKYLDFVDKKIKKLTMIKKDYNFEISVDGAISPQKIETLGKIGVQGFIVGTSSLFGKKESYQNLIPELKHL